MAETTSRQEYEEKTKANSTIEGYGPDGMRIHQPCFFCAEPDMLVYKLDEMQTLLANGVVCKHCGRGIKAIIDTMPNSTTMTLVQTVGPDPAPWAYLPRSRETS